MENKSRVEQALEVVETRKIQEWNRHPSEVEKILAGEVRRLQAELSTKKDA